MQEERFTFKYYTKLVDTILSNGYSIANYDNYENFEKVCIFRHDVDYDIQKAKDFAIFESKICDNLSSTYFILLSSDFYNVFSLNSLRAIETIINSGHEIGLHFDETRYNINNNEKLFKEFVEEELFLLEKAIGKEIKVVSMHRPSKFILDRDIKFDKAINSYSRKFFKEFKYISDSRMNWREDAIPLIESKKFNKLHLLTHPFWYSEKEETTKEKLFQFINRARYERYSYVSENFSKLEEFINKEELL